MALHLYTMTCFSSLRSHVVFMLYYNLVSLFGQTMLVFMTTEKLLCATLWNSSLLDLASSYQATRLITSMRAIRCCYNELLAMMTMALPFMHT